MLSKINYSIALFIFSLSLAFAHSGGGANSPQTRNTAEVSEPEFEDDTGIKDVHGKLIQETIVNGYALKFKIVDVENSIADGGSHNLLVNIQHEGRIQYQLSVDASVVNTEGEIQSKSMMELGDWYLAGYDFNPEEKYTITVSFTSTDGINHSSTINYSN